MPQDTYDNPCDVILVVEDGRKLKAHSHIFADASPFFKLLLLYSNMREGNEGVVHLEELSEPVLGDILEFIYTGCVQIWTEDRARDLIAMADYFLLPQLKSLAEGFLIQKLNCSNCVSIYRFAETYQCDDLVTGTEEFIFAKFSTLAKTEEFLSFSITEVEKWISSNEIHVSAEEDVFEFILTWIDHHDEAYRGNYFSNLFRHVRLVHVSHDYLRSNIETNELVKDDECCSNLLKSAVKSIESQNFGSHFVAPRKSLETPVVLVLEKGEGKHKVCYFPREKKWCQAPENIPPFKYRTYPSHDKVYLTSQSIFSGGECNLLRYDSFFDCSTSLSCELNKIMTDMLTTCHIFLRDEDELYALVSERGKCLSIETRITKYKSETKSWEDLRATFDWGMRSDICIIARDDLVYFLGGRVGYSCCVFTCVPDAYRFDLSNNMWQKLAEMKEERWQAYGAASHGKVFVVGGRGPPLDLKKCGSSAYKRSCEVYNEATDEWQLMASLKIPRGFCQGHAAGLMCVDDKLYSVCEYSAECSCHPNTRQVHPACIQHTSIRLECYDPGNNEWNTETELPAGCVLSVGQACSISVFKGSKFLQNVSPLKRPIPSQRESLEHNTFPDKADKRLAQGSFTDNADKRLKQETLSDKVDECLE